MNNFTKEIVANLTEAAENVERKLSRARYIVIAVTDDRKPRGRAPAVECAVAMASNETPVG